MGTEAQARRQLKTVVAERYKLTSLLGVGPHSRAYRAVDRVTGDVVVLKIVDRDANTNPSVSEWREMLGGMPVNDGGALPEGGFFLVSNLLDVRSLETELASNGPLEAALAVRLVLHVCSAFFLRRNEGAFSVQFEAANVYLSRSGGQEVLRFSVHGAAGLHPPYEPNVSPDVAQERIYGDAESLALGLLLYRMLTAKPALDAEGRAWVGAGLVPVVPPRVANPSTKISEELESVVVRAIAGDPTLRYASAEELAEGLKTTPEGRIALSSRINGPPRGDVTGGAEATHPGRARQLALPMASDGFNTDLSNAVSRYLPGGAPQEVAGPAVESEREPHPREVQVSVYRPGVVAPEQWYVLAAYVHAAEPLLDEATDPFEEVERRARAILGDDFKSYRATTQEATVSLPQGGQVTLVPDVPGVEFNPPSRSFRFEESVHEEVFRLRAARSAEGTTVRGRVNAFLGPILLAEVDISFRVDSRAPGKPPREVSRAKAYRQIFASYSHADSEMVKLFEDFGRTYGDDFLIDVQAIRAGERWSEKLERLIDSADVFQLFWSRNSMYSKFCKHEWEYALALRRNHFVRPVYWEHPMPKDEAADLPPEELRSIQFAHFGHPVVERIATRSADVVVCAICGRDNQSRYKFCMSCGATLAPAGAAMPFAPSTFPPEGGPAAPPQALEYPPQAPAPAQAGGAHHVGAWGMVAPPTGRPRLLLSVISATGTTARLFLESMTNVAPSFAKELTAPIEFYRATVSQVGNQLFLVEPEPTPAVHLKLKAHEHWLLEDAQMFSIGQTLLRFDMSPELRAGTIGAQQSLGRLTVVSGPKGSGYVVRIPAGGLLCGRLTQGSLPGFSAATYVSLSEDQYVSAHHFVIAQRPDGHAYLSDVGSTNGTYVRPSSNHPLRSGDVLRVEEHYFQLSF